VTPETVDWRPWFALWLPATLLAAGAFVAFPGIDLAVSGWFGDLALGFPLAGSVAIGALRSLLLAATGGVLLAAFTAALLGAFSRAWRPFVLSAFALGPGLLVNGVIKRMSGRVRPINVEAFGGPLPFQPAFDFSGPCGSGCSFVSAETAAVGVAMMCLVLVAAPRLGPRSRRAVTVLAVLSVLVVAAIRVSFGAHFLSDVLGSIVLMSALVPALHILFGMGRISKRRGTAINRGARGDAEAPGLLLESVGRQ
jgi:membrane-associated phospholipid phosphatase